MKSSVRVFACLALLGLALPLRADAAVAQDATVDAQPARTGATQGGMDAQRAALHLSEAIRIQTVSYDDKPSPPADTLAAFRTFLNAAYPASHAVMTREEIGPKGLLFRWQGSDATAAPIIFAAHMDVVPADEDAAAWKYPPFEGRIAAGAVHGRGAMDMKGQLVSIFEALEALAQEGFQPRRTIYVALGGDEETEGQGAQAIAATLKARGVRAEFILDEGPVVLDPFELTEKRAAFIGVAEKGYGTLLVTARDEGGHSSVPSADPGLVRLSRAIIAVDKMPVRTGFTDSDKVMLDALAADMTGLRRFAISNTWLFGPLVKHQITAVPAGRALLGTTLAPTMVSGAAKENQMPGVSRARINVRIHPRDTADAILANARRATDGIADVTVDWAAAPIPATGYASTRSDAYALLVKHVGRLAGDTVPIAPVLVFGGTDSRYYSEVVENTYRFQPYILTQEDVAKIHGRDEALSIANLDRAVHFFHGFIKEAASR